MIGYPHLLTNEDMTLKIRNSFLSLMAVGVIGLATVSNLAQAAATATPAASFSADQKTQIEQIVHDYLVTKPEVLIEASKSLQEKQISEASSKAKGAIAKNAASLFSTVNAPKFGAANGDITVVEFLDYQCGHCKQMSPVIAELLKTDPKVQVVIRGLPIFGDTSKLATKAVIASTKQGTDKFVKFHDGLLTTPDHLTDKSIFEIAKKNGLDVDKLKKDMESKEVADQIAENFRLAREIGLMGTPAFIIGNRGYSKTEFIAGATTNDALTATIAKLRS